MGNKAHETKSSAPAPAVSNKGCKDKLRRLQVELVELQRHFIKCDDRTLIILEGRNRSARLLSALSEVSSTQTMKEMR